MQLIIRKAKKSDLPATASLFRKILSELPYYNRDAKRSEKKKYSLEHLREMLRKDPYSVVVVENNESEIVGFSFSECESGTIWADWVGIDKKYRNKGLGEKLMKYILWTARKRKAHKVWLDTRTENVPSVRMLEKLNFRKIGIVKNHWYGQDFFLWEKFV